MSELRIRIKLSDQEFEFSGPADAVERQFEAFRNALIPPPPPTAPVEEKPMPEVVETSPLPPPLPLDKIVRVRDTICSLLTPSKREDAILVILLAQRVLRGNDNVSGAEIMEGLRQSGIKTLRVDTFLKKHAHMARVVMTGQHRRRRYRLSSDGVNRAEQIVRALAEQIPDADSSATSL